jgi:hypothetical protein
MGVEVVVINYMYLGEPGCSFGAKICIVWMCHITASWRHGTSLESRMVVFEICEAPFAQQVALFPLLWVSVKVS